MSSFTPRLLTPAAAEPDPTKHVNYSLGMVLGVDDFTQEFAYLSGRDQWLARDLLGYGTVSGLRVGLEVETSGPQVSVTPGVALSPRGRLIRVAPGQCAGLNGWLAAHHGELLALLGSPDDDLATLRLFVVLGYRECPTDAIPIPGQPCRSEDETTAASRIADDFRLELRLAPPDQQEEDALRDFVAWLGQVEITDEPGGMLTVAEFEDAIRHAAHFDTSPPSSPPDYMYGSPPEALRIHPSLAYEYLRAAFRVWVTELRPRWQPRWVGKGQGCSGSASDAAGSREEDCVLLAELHLRLVRVGSGADWQVEDENGVTIHEERRPYLMHLRMVQEWLLGRGHSASGGEPASTSMAVVPAFTVEDETAFGQASNVGTSLDYARADHTHGTPPLPALAGDVTGDAGNTSVARIRNVEVDAATPADGQVLTYVADDKVWRAADSAQAGAAVTPETSFGLSPSAGTSDAYARADHTHGTPPAPPPPTLVGDATGPVGETVVARIRGITVNPATPSNGQVLAYDSGLNRWSGTTLPAATPPPAPATAVSDERTFNRPVVVGTSLNYARADHSHGTPPAPVIGGDVSGTLPTSIVQGIRGRSILDIAPGNNQVLTFDAAQNAWRPAAVPSSAPAGDFVTRPAGLPAYSIVAAGVVRGDDSDPPPANRFNGLRIRRFETGRITVTFDNYVDPASKNIQYIVKAMAVTPPDTGLSGIVVNFESFLKTEGLGFTLLVTTGQGPVPADQLKTMEFMIEVSQYDFRVGRVIEDR